jgi:hypothetical protein
MANVTLTINEELLDFLRLLGGEAFSNTGGTWALTPLGLDVCARLAQQVPLTSAELEDAATKAYNAYPTIANAKYPDGTDLPIAKFVP